MLYIHKYTYTYIAYIYTYIYILYILYIYIYIYIYNAFSFTSRTDLLGIIRNWEIYIRNAKSIKRSTRMKRQNRQGVLLKMTTKTSLSKIGNT